jgi:hypothetical protein
MVKARSGSCDPPRAVAPSATAASKTVMMVAAMVTESRAGMLKTNTRAKRPVVAQSPATKGKQTRVDVGPLLASITPHRVDGDRVAYYVLLHSVPSVESCSSSSSDSTVSKSIMASPPPILDLRISVELPHVTEVPEAEAAEGSLSIVVILTLGM